MLNMTLKELKDQELENVEKICFDIESRLKGTSEIKSKNVFATVYLAYLVADNELQNTKELSNYIENQLSFEQSLFLKECIGNLWSVAIEIAHDYTVENLLATILWMPISNRRSEPNSETPESIVNLATRILNINNEKVADFCCGVGNFLINAIEQDKNSKYYGIEINTHYKEISNIRLNLISDYTEIEQGTVFDLNMDKKFDKIFCDYPWNILKHNTGINKEKLQEFESVVPEIKKVAKSDWLFIINVERHLKSNGKAVVIATNGTTWNGGIDKKIRERFLKMGLIEAVISLPANLYSTTAIPVSMIVLSKSNKMVRMVDARSMASVGRRQNVLSNETIDQIVHMMTEDTENSKCVTFEEIEKEDFAINPSRFIYTEAEVENGIPFGNVITNITRGAQVKASILDEMVSDNPTDYQYLMLANIQNGIINDDLPFIKSIDKKLEKYCVKNNSLVISKNGTPAKVAVVSVPEERKVLANGNLYVIELDETKVNPYFVKAYLESENGGIALSRIMVGAVMPNIPVDGLKKIIIPCPEKDKQNKIAEKYLAKIDEIKVLKYKLSKAIAEMETIYEEE